MQRLFPMAALVLAACSPSLDWREVREGTNLIATLPCKPDRGSRTVPLAGRDTELRMLGCDAAGMTFAVARAHAGEGSRVAQVRAHWQAASVANVAGKVVRESAFAPRGAADGTRLSVTGHGIDGRPLQSEAAYFARGNEVFQAVIYGPSIPPDAADAFFTGLRLE